MPRWVYLILLVALVAGNVLLYRMVFASPVLSVKVLNVGEKSHATLVQSPGGKMVLIDTGRDASILRALGAALPMWQRRLDAVILTSASASAKGGLPDVENRYKISTVIRSAYRGDRFALGDGTFIDVLWPPKTPAPMNADNSRLVLLLSYGSTSILIQNDLPPRISRYLNTLDANLPSPTLTISSTTLANTFISDGYEITENL